MAKLKDIQQEVFNRLSKKYMKQISILDVGKHTRGEKPWFHTIVTDSDQGSLIIFLISDKCYEDEYKDNIIKAIVDGALQHCSGSININEDEPKTNNTLRRRIQTKMAEKPKRRRRRTPEELEKALKMTSTSNDDSSPEKRKKKGKTSAPLDKALKTLLPNKKGRPKGSKNKKK